jgi:hypothetical protein
MLRISEIHHILVENGLDIGIYKASRAMRYSTGIGYIVTSRDIDGFLDAVGAHAIYAQSYAEALRIAEDCAAYESAQARAVASDAMYMLEGIN